LKKDIDDSDGDSFAFARVGDDGDEAAFDATEDYHNLCPLGAPVGPVRRDMYSRVLNVLFSKIRHT
jgi:hypothetical protein